MERRATWLPRAARPRAALLVAVTACAALLAGCSGSSGTPASGSPVPALQPGSYSTRAFNPSVNFTVPAGWWMAADSADYAALQPVSSDAVGIHLFRDPQPASQDPTCPLAAQPGVGRLPTDLVTWISGLPGLTVSNPRLVTVGGLRGTEIDVAIAVGWKTSCSFANGVPTVPLFVGRDGSLRWVIAGTERLRLDLLDAPGGGTVVVDLDAFVGSEMDNLLSAAGPIVRSFTFAAK